MPFATTVDAATAHPAFEEPVPGAVAVINNTDLPEEYKIRIKTRCQGSEIVFYPSQPITLIIGIQARVRLKFPCRDFPLPEALLPSRSLRGPPASNC